jgi:hypothetical protein
VNANNLTIDTITMTDAGFILASIQFPAATVPPALQPNIYGVAATPESSPQD